MTTHLFTIKMAVSRTVCCVYGCKSCKLKDPSLLFFHFPAKSDHKIYITTKLGLKEGIERRQLWERVLIIQSPSKNARVCSKHFLATDYVKRAPGSTIKRIRLKKTAAVPSQNLPTRKSSVVLTTKQIASRENRKARYLRRNNLRQQLLQTSVPHTKENVETNSIAIGNCESLDHIEEEPCENIIQRHDLTKDEQEAISGLLFLCSNVTENRTFEKSVQVTSGDFVVRLIDNIKTKSELKSLTNLDNFKVLNDLEELIIKFYAPQTLKLTIKEKVTLVLMKLKLAVTFRILSFFFKVTPSSCSQIFDEYIFYLKEVLDLCIPWPSKEECSRNMPKSFSTFLNVRCIVDCTEIEVQVPKCLCCRVRTYSHYKGKHTIKFMTGISPGGLLTFVSRGYGGRASDKAIFEQSDLITLFEPHVDKIMVDKGFLIDDICEEHGIGILRPFFLRKKKQFSQSESKINVQVAKARVHVERMNQRLRTFGIFNSRFLWSQVKNIDHIIRVCGALVNLQSPIMANNKFLP